MKTDILFFSKTREIISSPDFDCIGVVIRCCNESFVIEKYGETNKAYGNKELFTWGGYGETQDGIHESASIDGSIYESGYVPHYDGLYSGTPYLNESLKLWTSGALSDTDGLINSRHLPHRKTLYGGSEYDNIGELLDKFNMPAESRLYTDWYVPSVRQLALIAMYIGKINKALTAIGGSPFENAYYWSSTAFNKSCAWCVFIKEGCINNDFKSVPYHVRFVRSLPFNWGDTRF